MPSNSEINTNKPIQISAGGTNTASLTDVNGTVYFNGISYTTTDPGSSLECLTINGSGIPEYAPTTGTDAWEILDQQTASSSPDLVFSTGISSSYGLYMVQFIDIFPDTASRTFQMSLSGDGGSTYYNYLVGGYYGYNQVSTVTSQAPIITNFHQTLVANLTFPNVTYVGDVSVTPQLPLSGVIFFNALSDYTQPTWVGDIQHGISGSPGIPINFVSPFGAVSGLTSLTVNTLKFLFNGGNIASGSITLYGLRV